jgi:hypothetical protein
MRIHRSASHRELITTDRSRSLQSAVDLLSQQEKRTRLARELKKLNVPEERRLAEEGLGDEAWPVY